MSQQRERQKVDQTDLEHALAIRSDDRWLQESTAHISPGELAKAEALVNLGFDPALHLGIFQGSVIVTEDGAWWWFRGDPELLTMLSKPVAADLKEAYGLAPDDIGVVTQAYRKGESMPICEGFGKASMRPYTYHAMRKPDNNASAEVWEKYNANLDHPDRHRNPLETAHTYRMAVKRAEVDCALKARGLGVNLGPVTELQVSEARVNRETGEIPMTAEAAAALERAMFGPEVAAPTLSTEEPEPEPTPVEEAKANAAPVVDGTIGPVGAETLLQRTKAINIAPEDLGRQMVVLFGDSAVLEELTNDQGNALWRWAWEQSVQEQETA